jgi:hypothetical protein
MVPEQSPAYGLAVIIPNLSAFEIGMAREAAPHDYNEPHRRQL